MQRSLFHIPDMRQSLFVACIALVCTTSCARSSSLPLEGTHWTATSLGAAAEPIAATHKEVFLVLGPEPGRAFGSGGCNSFSASYERSGDKLTFGRIAGTRMACADGMEVESDFANALASAAGFRIAGEKLELVDAAGALLATFSAKPEP